MSLAIAPAQVHAKAVLKDVEGAVPDEAPMMIWDDEIDLGWSSDEVAALRGEVAELKALLEETMAVAALP